MTVSFSAIGSFNSTATSTLTLTLPVAPSDGIIAVACIDSGHPTAATVPTGPDDWAFVRTFVGTSGVYGADAGPRRISLYIRELQGDEDDTVVFTMDTGTESRLGGAIVILEKASGQPVIRYRSAAGEDTSSGTGFSAALSPSLDFDADEGEFLVLAYVVATDTTFSAEAVSASGVTFGTITERGDTNSSVGADAGRAIATGGVNSGDTVAGATVTATLASASIGVAALLKLRDAAADGGPATITAVYDSDDARVQLAITRLDPNSTTVDVERSVDQIAWKPVRGGIQLEITELSAVADDFDDRTVVDGLGSAPTGQSWTTSGGAAGDYDVTAGVATLALPDVASRNGVVGDVGLTDVEVYAEATLPATATGDSYFVAVVARRTDSSNFYVLRAGADTAGNVDPSIQRFVAGSGTTIASASNSFTYSPGDTVGMRFRVIGNNLLGRVWNATAGDEPTDWTIEALDSTYTAGATGIRAQRNGGNTNVGLVPAFDNFAVTERTIEIDDYEFRSGVTNYYRVTAYNAGLVVSDIETTSITPTVTAVWIKSTMRSFLNRTWTLAGPGFAAAMPVRGGLPWPQGRSYPVAVSDVRGSRTFSLAVITDSLADARTLDYVLASGDVLFLQAPDSAYAMFTGHGYVLVVGEPRVVYPNPNDATRITVIPLREVVAPGPDITTAAATWDSLIGALDWDSAVITTYPTWDDLADLVGDPSEVIVP